MQMTTNQYLTAFGEFFEKEKTRALGKEDSLELLLAEMISLEVGEQKIRHSDLENEQILEELTATDIMYLSLCEDLSKIKVGLNNFTVGFKGLKFGTRTIKYVEQVTSFLNKQIYLME